MAKSSGADYQRNSFAVFEAKRTEKGGDEREASTIVGFLSRAGKNARERREARFFFFHFSNDRVNSNVRSSFDSVVPMRRDASNNRVAAKICFAWFSDLIQLSRCLIYGCGSVRYRVLPMATVLSIYRGYSSVARKGPRNLFGIVSRDATVSFLWNS